MPHLAFTRERCDGLSRREVLRIGSLSAIGLTLPKWTMRRANAAETPAARATRCVLIWLDGGPSHLETFDVKPDAPAEVRGPLASISTRLPGIALSECLPQTAALLDHMAIVRSVTSPLGEHNFGTHYLLTGYKPSPVLDYPTFGSVLTHRRPTRGTLPANIAVPDFRVGGGRMTGAGFLPAATQPFSVSGDPAQPDFAVRDLELFRGLSLKRLQQRREFVEQLNQFQNELERAAPDDASLEQAFQLITSPSAKRAFALEDEPDVVRNRYGRRTVGQSCLLARRLIERGVPFVTVNHRGWDTHNDLYTRLKEGYTGAKVPVGLIPTLDQGLTALVSDLRERGLLQDTLIVVMGEFGRTPKLNTSAGRDHWPRVFSVLLAGGGVPGGQVIGSSDAVGESPAERAVTPADLAFTIYTLLGIDPTSHLQTGDGREVRISPTDGKRIPELIG